MRCTVGAPSSRTTRPGSSIRVQVTNIHLVTHRRQRPRDARRTGRHPAPIGRIALGDEQQTPAHGSCLELAKSQFTRPGLAESEGVETVVPNSIEARTSSISDGTRSTGAATASLRFLKNRLVMGKRS